MSEVTDAKVCTKCKKKKPLSEYHHDKQKRRKYSSCKKCHNKHMQIYSKRMRQRKNIISPEKKFCSLCGTIKPASEFTPNKSTIDGLFAWCKGCASDKQYEKRPKQTRGWLETTYGHLHCTDCRGKFPWECMDFDHKEKFNKSFNVCNYKATTQITPKIIKELEAEIAFCEVVCSNCHRIRTTTRFNKKRTKRQTVRDVHSIKKQETK